jgi:phosphatidylglycerophosphatase A
MPTTAPSASDRRAPADVRATEAAAPAPRPAANPWARLVATGLGSGHSPVAPGTAGSAVGLLLFWPLAQLPAAAQVAATLIVFLGGVAAATHVSRTLGAKDPGLVVVDEVVGMWVTLLFVPFTTFTAVVGFFAFRAMDVFKPYPARQLEHLREGWGIMADDLMAGVYANLLVRLALMVAPGA